MLPNWLNVSDLFYMNKKNKCANLIFIILFKSFCAKMRTQLFSNYCQYTINPELKFTH